MFKLLSFVFLAFWLVGCGAYKPEEILSKYRPSVALLRNGDSICTTFHVGDGLFITAKHCIEGESAKDLVIQDSTNKTHIAQLIYVDADDDVAVLRSDELPVTLKIWGPLDGKIYAGKQIMTLGHPGYYLADFTFEIGYVTNIRKIDGKAFIISKNMTYPGESGGPVIMLENGKVIGLAIAMAERIQMLGTDGAHQHNTLSIILPWHKIAEALEHARVTESL